MRIDPNTRTLGSAESPSAARSNSGQTPSAAGVSMEESGSGSQTQVRALAVQMQQSPEIRQNKVEALAHAIRNGQYQVSSEQIANSLFSEMAGNTALIR
jgi:flagellar biosynthesis anti-sigma factor FlgM